MRMGNARADAWAFLCAGACLGVSKIGLIIGYNRSRVDINQIDMRVEK